MQSNEGGAKRGRRRREDGGKTAGREGEEEHWQRRWMIRSFIVFRAVLQIQDDFLKCFEHRRAEGGAKRAARPREERVKKSIGHADGS